MNAHPPQATASPDSVPYGTAEPARGTGAGHPAAPARARSPRVARLARDLDELSGPDARAAALDRFWAEVRTSGTPLIEPLPNEPHHRAVTFLWRGGGTTGAVLLLANRLIDRGDYTSGLMEHLDGTDVWHFTYRLRADHRGSYRVAATEDAADLTHDRLRALAAEAVGDPLNPRTIATRWHGPPGSVFALPEAPPQPWAGRRDGVPRGEVQRHRLSSEALGATRDVWAYLPPTAAEAPDGADVLLLLDGDMWFGQLAAENLFDNLHADGAVRPLVVLAPDAVDNATRMREFGGRQPYTDFLTEELLPWAAARWPLCADPRRTTVAGQSLGGLGALHVGLEQRTHRVGNVVAQSPSLWWRPDIGPGIPSKMDTGEQWMSRRFAELPVREGLRVRLDVGLHEGAMATMVRELLTRLDSRGYPTVLTEFNGGHDYTCWSGALADGLAALHTF
ncbi:enterochelin esterase [Streptomyces sulphureus]|uniref:enterochelin esterase n=1 Tax=Streptomyces sulphureus TaxID=47758 RepID=UPI000374CF9D|nr:enterochelin esterase [Streptomyces sulphureus]